MAGYSNKTLIEKLDIKDGASLFFINPPRGYKKLLGKLPTKTKTLKKMGKNVSFIHFFVLTKKELDYYFPKLRKSLKKDGMLWVSWPKGKKQVTDLREDIVRAIGLRHGLVDIKVISIDDIWSGLKFVWRFKDR